MLLLLLTGVARALPPGPTPQTTPQIPLLYAGDPAEAVTRAGSDANVPVWDLHPARIGETMSGGLLRALGANQPPPCSSVPTTNTAVRDAVMHAEGDVSYQRWSQALTELTTASNALNCLSEPSEASLASRLKFLTGIALTATGQPNDAVSEFQQAIYFQPSLAWDGGVSPDFRAPFDAASAAARAIVPATAAPSNLPRTPMGQVLLGPGVSTATTLWVDGRLATVSGAALSLPAGTHLVQILQPTVATVAVHVDPLHPVALLVPLQTPDALVDHVEIPGNQLVLGAIADQAFPEAQDVYLWAGDRTWHAEQSEGQRRSWHEVPQSNAFLEARKKRVAGGVRLAGAVLAGTGAASAGVGVLVWSATHDATGPESDAEYRTRTAAAGGGSALFTSGLVTVGLGVVAFGLSFPLGGG